MSKTFFESYSDQRILRMDFSGLSNPAETLEYIAEAKSIVATQPRKSLRVLLDVRDSAFNKEVVSAIGDLAKHDEPYVVASAIVGVEGLMNLILKGVSKATGRNFALFQDLDSARRWLVQQDKR